MNSKDVIYTEDFLNMDTQAEINERLYSAFSTATQLEDREYGVKDSLKNAVTYVANKAKKPFVAGAGLAKVENKIEDAKAKSEGEVKADKVDYALGKNNPNRAKHIARNTAISRMNDGSLGKHASATRAAIESSNTNHKVGGAAVGAIAGAAVGSGLGHLATAKARREINELESKKDLTHREEMRLKALKAKVRNAKIAGAALTGIAGGFAGHHLGSKMAKKKKFQLVKAHQSKKRAAKAAYDAVTKS